MNGSAHFFEHRITRSYEGRYGRLHALAIALFIICPILLLFFMLWLIGAGAFIWFVPLSPTAILLCKRGIYDRFFGRDYCYTVSAGTLTVTSDHDGRYKREETSFSVSDAEIIAPYHDNRSVIDALKVDRRIEAVKTMKGEDVYAIAYTDKDGKKILLFIDGLSVSVKLLKLYNKVTVVKQTKY